MKQLDPKYVWLYTIQSIIIAAFGILLPGLIFTIIFSYVPQEEMVDAPEILIFFLNNWIWAFVGLSVFGHIWGQLSYHFYKYEMREDGFRKEHGVIVKRYTTIPYERIQNVDIIRGPIARMLGISGLYIQTAGISGVALAEGNLPALAPLEAENLRDELVKRAGKSRSQGV